jgi:phage terminase small subunit
MLTPKQMAFCEEYLRNGGNGTEAYLAAYDGNSRTTAKIEACRLLARDDIKAHMLKLRQPIEKAIKRKIINEREYKKKLIQERIDECVERGDDAAIARYLEIWNKMDGEYVNINKDITERETDIKNLDNETLMRLAMAENALNTDTAECQ